MLGSIFLSVVLFVSMPGNWHGDSVGFGPPPCYASANDGIRDAIVSTPVDEVFSHSVRFYDMRVLAVSYLLRLGCPSDISRLVVSVVIWKTVNGVSWTGSRADVREEVRKAVGTEPLVTDSNTTTTIAVPTLLPWVRATGLHGSPRPVFIGERSTNSSTVPEIAYDSVFVRQAPAGFDFSHAHGITAHIFFNTAITPHAPHCSVFSASRVSDHDKSPPSRTHQVLDWWSPTMRSMIIKRGRINDLFWGQSTRETTTNGEAPESSYLAPFGDGFCFSIGGDEKAAIFGASTTTGLNPFSSWTEVTKTMRRDDFRRSAIALTKPGHKPVPSLADATIASDNGEFSVSVTSEVDVVSVVSHDAPPTSALRGEKRGGRGRSALFGLQTLAPLQCATAAGGVKAVLRPAARRGAPGAQARAKRGVRRGVGAVGGPLEGRLGALVADVNRLVRK